MAKQQFIIPSNPADLQRIKKAVKEASDCMVRIEGEKDEIKSIAEVMQEELAVPKTIFSKLVKVYHKQSYDKEVAKNEEFTEFYEKVMQ